MGERAEGASSKHCGKAREVGWARLSTVRQGPHSRVADVRSFHLQCTRFPNAPTLLVSNRSTGLFCRKRQWSTTERQKHRPLAVPSYKRSDSNVCKSPPRLTARNNAAASELRMSSFCGGVLRHQSAYSDWTILAAGLTPKRSTNGRTTQATRNLFA